MKFETYGLVADVHAHSWSQFSKVGPDKVNSRLRAILDELERAADQTVASGGKYFVVAGDLFHVRGKIEPSVYNPTFDAFERIAKKVEVIIIPGNHDLEGDTADSLGNAMQQLQRINGVTVVIEPLVTEQFAIVPWIERLDDLRVEIAKHADPKRDLIIHAPLNGVIRGLPDHGLEPQELAALGYKRVFVGHYHNHKSFEGDRVFSIGATTHQTWSDPETKAGFVLVSEVAVVHYETKAPLFVNIGHPNEIIRGKIEGNYVRLKLVDVEEDVLKDARANLDAMGALNWVDHSSKKRQITRQANPQSNVRLEVSVATYIVKEYDAGNLDRKELAKRALNVLTEARTLGAE